MLWCWLFPFVFPSCSLSLVSMFLASVCVKFASLSLSLCVHYFLFYFDSLSSGVYCVLLNFLCLITPDLFQLCFKLLPADKSFHLISPASGSTFCLPHAFSMTTAGSRVLKQPTKPYLKAYGHHSGLSALKIHEWTSEVQRMHNDTKLAESIPGIICMNNGWKSPKQEWSDSYLVARILHKF